MRLLICVLSLMFGGTVGCGETVSMPAGPGGSGEVSSAGGKEDRVGFSDADEVRHGTILFVGAAPAFERHSLRLFPEGSSTTLGSTRIGEPIRLLAGSYCARLLEHPRIDLRVGVWEGIDHVWVESGEICGIRVVAGQQTEIPLAAWRMSVEMPENAGFGYSPTVHFKVTPPTESGSQTVEGDLAAGDHWRPDGWFHVVPGDLQVWIDGQTETIRLEPGETFERHIAPEVAWADIVLVPPSDVELPDVPYSCEGRPRYVLTYGPPGEPSMDGRMVNSNRNADALEIGETTLHAPAHEEFRVRVLLPEGTRESDYQYHVYVNGFLDELALEPFETNEVHMRRLDVDNVNVRGLDGEIYEAVAYWTAQRYDEETDDFMWGQFFKSDCDWSMSAPFVRLVPSGQGIDLLPGLYRVDADWTTRDGTANEGSVEVDLRD